MKETAAKVIEVASRTRAGRVAEQLKREWEIAAVGLPKARPAPAAADHGAIVENAVQQ